MSWCLDQQDHQYSNDDTTLNDPHHRQDTVNDRHAADCDDDEEDHHGGGDETALCRVSPHDNLGPGSASSTFFLGATRRGNDRAPVFWRSCRNPFASSRLLAIAIVLLLTMTSLVLVLVWNPHTENRNTPTWTTSFLRNHLSNTSFEQQDDETRRRIQPVWQSCPFLDDEQSASQASDTTPDQNPPRTASQLVILHPVLAFEESMTEVPSEEQDDAPILQAYLHRASANALSRNSPHALCILAVTNVLPNETMATLEDPLQQQEQQQPERDWIPIARSYNGHDWEHYTTSRNWRLQSQVHIECSTTNIAEGCILSLPPFPSSNHVYIVTSYFASEGEATAFSLRNEYARFLEQATFGVTTADLDHLAAMGTRSEPLASTTSTTHSTTTSTTVSLSTTTQGHATTAMAKWIQEQQQTVEPTLHRSWFRRHVNAAFPSSNMYGTVTHPCRAHSFYRHWTFSPKHVRKLLYIDRIHGSSSSSSNDTKRTLSLHDETANNSGRLVWTVVDGPLYYQHASSFTPFPESVGYVQKTISCATVIL